MFARNFLIPIQLLLVPVGYLAFAQASCLRRDMNTDI
jgi:hypothetical protein